VAHSRGGDYPIINANNKEIMEVIEVDINLLKPAEYNPRAMDEKEAKDLRVSLDEFGMVEPIVVNKAKGRENVIIGGHQRVNVLKEMGKTKVPVVYVNIPDIEKEKELNLRLNKNLGHWDWDLLANFDEELLKQTGFSEEELVVGFGLNKAEMENVDPDRLQILEVYPPEAPKLKEKAQIHFDNFDDYQKVKKSILEGSLTAKNILELLK
jgi:ParB-like chromosome segregation protein Spo0J